MLPGLEEFGTIDDMLRPLVAGELSTDRRASIEDRIRRCVVDPGELASSSILPSDHPLRLEAQAIAEAMAIVTSRRAEDSELRLVCVSRRSPLAPWKHLIRGIASFYRGDDGACRTYLEAIDPASAPARLSPALHAMLDHRDPKALGAAARRLFGEVAGRSAELERALGELDLAFSSGNPTRILRCLRRAIDACSKHRPDLVVVLRQQASVRCMIRGLEPGDVRRSMGGPSLRDSNFWRLLARVEESRGDTVAACVLWDEFRRQAIHEGLLSPGGVETAAVYAHMAAKAESAPRSLRPFAQRHAEQLMELVSDYYEGQPEPIRNATTKEPRAVADLVDPTRLYEKAALLDPSPEIFGSWMSWELRSGRSWKPVEKTALAWHEADPANVEPLIELVSCAAERGAYKKALKFLELAERADAFHPRVRGARLRLGLLTFSKHVHERKLHLAEKDVAALEEAPDSGSAGRPALFATLRWLLAGNRGNHDEALRHAREIDRSLATAHGGALLRHAVSALCRRPLPWDDRREPAWPPGSARAEEISALGRTCALARDVALRLRMPEAWNKGLVADVAQHSGRVDPNGLRAMAEVAIDDQNLVAAYALSGAGLQAGGALVPRFLLLRARALPGAHRDRRLRCLAAAAALARRRGDRDLLSEIGRARDEIVGFSAFEDAESPLDAPAAEELVREEAQDLRFPSRSRRRGRRGRRSVPTGDDELDLEASIGTLPDQFLQGFWEAVQQAALEGELPAELAGLDPADLLSGLIPDLLAEMQSEDPRPTRAKQKRRRR